MTIFALNNIWIFIFKKLWCYFVALLLIIQIRTCKIHLFNCSLLSSYTRRAFGSHYIKFYSISILNNIFKKKQKRIIIQFQLFLSKNEIERGFWTHSEWKGILSGNTFHFISFQYIRHVLMWNFQRLLLELAMIVLEMVVKFSQPFLAIITSNVAWFL